MPPTPKFCVGDEVIWTDPFGKAKPVIGYISYIGGSLVGGSLSDDIIFYKAEEFCYPDPSKFKRHIWIERNLEPYCKPTIFCPECEEEDYAFVDDYLCAACRCASWESLDG